MVVTGTVAPADASASASKRLFNLLEAESKERVLRCLTSFRTLTPLEQAAAAQELGVVLPKDTDASRAGDRPLHGAALAVRRRDCSYVTLSAHSTPFHSSSPSAAAAPGEAELSALVRESFPAIAERSEEKSEEKSGESSRTPSGVSQHNRLHASTFDDDPPNNDNDTDNNNNKEKGAKEGLEVEKVVEKADGGVLEVLYRNRGYQALRLARGEEQREVETPFLRPRVKNQTGMPFMEEDLREWFELLDKEGRGELGVVPFLQHIYELDRGFGVNARAEEEFKEEVYALAENDVLTFEKFAYLVSRFARH